ncbi:hypothetical protein GEV33_006740 [Tenebrio molitor]|uniref:Uncharacterized protein n=1 Tax=Tenebrio molitor TaxID=7067 RepID=A0A8J6LJG2_TENMO|nr:hypothetical protein GEV33_006740 [Tenebrio molitor]
MLRAHRVGLLFVLCPDLERREEFAVEEVERRISSRLSNPRGSFMEAGVKEQERKVRRVRGRKRRNEKLPILVGRLYRQYISEFISTRKRAIAGRSKKKNQPTSLTWPHLRGGRSLFNVDGRPDERKKNVRLTTIYLPVAAYLYGSIGRLDNLSNFFVVVLIYGRVKCRMPFGHRNAHDAFADAGNDGGRELGFTEAGPPPFVLSVSSFFFPAVNNSAEMIDFRQ